MAYESSGRGVVQSSDLNPEWYTAVLEEYKSLRSEAVTARDAQLSVLRLAVPLLAALIGLGVTQKDESFIGPLLLSVVVPSIVILTFELWIGEIQRSVRAGSVVAAIERRLGDVFESHHLGPPMGWEQWLRIPAKGGWPNIAKSSQQQHDSVVRVTVISVFLLVLAGCSLVLGLHFLWHNKYETLMWVNLVLVAGSIFFLIGRVIFAVFGIRSRDTVPDREEIWPAKA